MNTILLLLLFVVFSVFHFVGIASRGCVSLTTIRPQSISNLWKDRVFINLWLGKKGMKMGIGQTYSKFIIIHPLNPKGSATWALNGAYRRLTAMIGLTGTTNANCDGYAGHKGDTTWQIYLDEALVFTSQTFIDSSTYQNIDIDLTGKSSIRFVINTLGNAECDHATLAIPIICDDDSAFDVVAIVNGVERTQGPYTFGVAGHRRHFYLGRYILEVNSDWDYTYYVLDPQIPGYWFRIYKHNDGYWVIHYWLWCYEDNILDCTVGQWYDTTKRELYQDEFFDSEVNDSQSDSYDYRYFEEYWSGEQNLEIEVRRIEDSGVNAYNMATTALPENKAELSVQQGMILIGMVVLVFGLIIAIIIIINRCRRANIAKKMVTNLKEEEEMEEDQEDEEEEEEEEEEKEEEEEERQEVQGHTTI